MRLLLVSEGKHETGGALQTLVDRITGVRNQYVFHPANDAKIQASHGVRGIGSRLTKRIKAFGQLARKTNCDALIYLIDQDRDSERRHAITAAQVDPHASIAQALGVAVETFDAWILADETALSKVLGRNIDRQRDPEDIRDSKSVCERLRDESGLDLPLRQMYAQICLHVTLDTLIDRCPMGFTPFAERLRQLDNACDSA